jgi:hypothetical protein
MCIFATPLMRAHIDEEIASEDFVANRCDVDAAAMCAAMQAPACWGSAERTVPIRV